MRDNKKAEGPRINSIKYSFHRIVTTLNTYERVLTNRRIHLHVLWVLNGIIGLGVEFPIIRRRWNIAEAFY